MKKYAKFLVLALILALVVSALCVYASAYTASESNYKEVLEFYESYEYVSETFDGNSSEIFSDSTDEFSQVGSFTNTSVDKGVFSTDNLSRVELAVVPEEFKSFGLNYAFCFPDGTGKLTLEVKDSLGNQFPLLKLEGTKLKYQASEVVPDFEEPTNNVPFFQMTEDTDYSLTVDSFYDVMVYVSKERSDAFTVKITVSDRQSVPQTKVYTTTVSEFDFYGISLVYNSAVSSASVKLDYVEAYEGSFSHRLNDVDTVVGEYLVSMVNLHKADPNASFARELLETVNKVVIEHGYTSNEAVVLDAIEYYCQKLGDVYASEYVAAADGIDENAAYNDRLNKVKENDELYKLLEYIDTNFSDMTLAASGDTIAAAKAKFDSELQTLEDLKAKTIAYVEALKDTDAYSLDYMGLKAIYDVISENPVCPTFYDAEYSAEAVADAIEIGSAVVTEYTKKTAKATSFVDNVRIARDSANKTFAERYAAYLLAKSNYFEDTSYDAVITGDTILGLIADYNAVDAEMKEKSAYADEFLSKVNAALKTNNYTIKSTTLDEAETYLSDIERSYPGVAEAITEYNSLRTYISGKITSCHNYIKAVQAVIAATNIADKKAAIDSARELAIEGNDTTVVEKVNGTYVSVTYDGWKVTDANVRLASEISAITTVENRVQNFVNAVDAIGKATTTAARRAAINSAISIKESVDLTMDNAAAAATKLDSEIASYNADVEAGNAIQRSANVLAVSTVASVKGDVQSAKIVAILKKIYD